MPAKPRKSKVSRRRGPKIRGTGRRVRVGWSLDPSTIAAVDAEAAARGEPASQCAEKAIRSLFRLPPLAPPLRED